jgi:hypothetical protein
VPITRSRQQQDRRIGMSVVVLETKQHAEEAVAYPLPPLPGVTPLTVEIREVCIQEPGGLCRVPLLGQQLGGHDGGGEIAGVMGLGCIR